MAHATLSCCFAAIHLEAVKKTRRGRVFRPLQNPSFSERTRYGCGQKAIMVAVRWDWDGPGTFKMIR